jgi:hypothetical protein
VRKIALADVSNSLEIVVASVAEMRRPEAEKNGHRTAVTAFVLEEISSVLGTHLRSGHIRAAPAHELCRVVVVSLSSLGVTTSLTSIISLATQKVFESLNEFPVVRHIFVQC